MRRRSKPDRGRRRKPDGNGARRRKSLKTAVKSSAKRSVPTVGKSLSRQATVKCSAPKSAAINRNRLKRKRNEKPSVAITITAKENALSAANCSGRTAAVRQFAPRNAARNIITSTVLNGGTKNKPTKSYGRWCDLLFHRQKQEGKKF